MNADSKSSIGPPPLGRKGILVLSGILLLGLGLRVCYLREVVQSPGYDSPSVDAAFNDYWARAMAAGDWTPPKGEPDPQIRSRPYLRPPGYAYFLASIYRAFGLGFTAPRIVQMILGLESCLLAFAIARQAYGNAVGLIAAALTSSYWILIYFEGRFQEPALLTFVLLAFVWTLALWTERRTFRLTLAAGLLLGLAGLVKPNPLLFLPVGMLWVYWVGRRRGGRRPTCLKPALGLLAGSAIAVAPTAIRNAAVAGDFVLISANAGMNLYIGNNELAQGWQLGRLPGTSLTTTCFMYPQVVKHVEAEQGRAMKYSEVSSYFTAKALRFICRHPSTFAALTLRRAALFWGPQEISLNEEMNCERAFSGTLSKIPGGFPLVLSLCLLGAIRLAMDLKTSRSRPNAAAVETPRTREVSILLAAFVLTFFFSYVLFFNAASYRAPLIPFLAIFAAYGVHRVGQFAFRRDFRRATLWTAAGLVLFLAARVPIVPCETPGPAAWHCNRGRMYARKGRLDQAVAEGQAALLVNPADPQIHALMAVWLTERGSFDEARQHQRQAADLLRMMETGEAQPPEGTRPN